MKCCLLLQRAAPEPPKEAQERPKKRPGQPKRGQERPMGGPREAQETPRGAPEAHGSGPGSAQGGPQKAQERPRSGPRAPEVPRRAQNGSLGVKTISFTRFSRLRTSRMSVWPRFSSEKCSQTEVLEGSRRPSHVIYEGFPTARAQNPPYDRRCKTSRQEEARQEERGQDVTGQEGTREEKTRGDGTRGGKRSGEIVLHDSTY